MTKQGARRGGRIAREIPILLIGSDSEGRVFCEETKTVVVSLHGAGVISRYKLFAEQELILRCVETNREAEVRVVGEIGSQGPAHTYGIAFLDDTLNFWKMEFPPPPASCETDLASLTLECSGCSAPMTIENADLEFDVCAIHGGVVRYCGQCNLPTVWKRSTEVFSAPLLAGTAEKKLQPSERAASVLEPQPPSPPAPGAVAAQSGINRRLRVRAKVNYFACVRSTEFGDDIVVCIDMSRGGVCFKSRNCYLNSAMIQIAVPFSPESRAAPAIFVPARIAHVGKISAEGMYRCGVAFLPCNGTYTHI